jgi:uncharacterized membrane protein YkoI
MLGLSLLSGDAAMAAQTPAASESEQSTDTPVVGTPLLQPKIDLTRAQEIALEGQSNAVVTDVSLDGAGGVLAYSVELDNGVEVDVDATSGEVLKTAQADEDDDNGDVNGSGERENENGDDGEKREEENGSEQG